MRYEFSPHPEKDGWYVVTDTIWMMTCEFQAHRFNDTQNYTDLGALKHKDADTVAKAMAELGDWLFSHHYSDVFPVPTYELRRSGDDSAVMIIGHKKPHATVFVKAEEIDSLDDVTAELKKMIEFLRKRMNSQRK